MADDEQFTPEQDEKFKELFGVSRTELKANGEDVQKYVLHHISEAAARISPEAALSHKATNTYLAAVAFMAFGGVIALVVQKNVNNVAIAAAVVALWVLGSVVLLALAITSRRRLNAVQSARWQQQDDAVGASLLPYKATNAYISRGTAYFSKSYYGSVLVDKDDVTILDSDGSTLVQCAPARVTVQPVFIWMGLGVRLKMADVGRWNVQPYYSQTNHAASRREVRRFRAAIEEAKG